MTESEPQGTPPDQPTPKPNGKVPPPKSSRSLLKAAFRWSLGIVVGIALVIAATSYYVGGPSNLRNLILGPPPQPTDLPPNPAAFQEWQSASADHDIIAAAVAACSKIFDLDTQPHIVRTQLRVGLSWYGLEFANNVYKPDEKPPANELRLTNFERAAIYFSDAIKRARIETATYADSNSSSMIWFQFAIVAIGAITTILISIKSISGSGQSQSTAYFWIGIAAIIFSSVGTATSALNSFYAPRETYLKSERSLSALRQLHSDIVAKVTSATNLDDPKQCPHYDPIKEADSPYAKQIQEWSTRLGAIVNSSDTSNTSTQGNANPGGSNTTLQQPTHP